MNLEESLRAWRLRADTLRHRETILRASERAGRGQRRWRIGLLVGFLLSAGIASANWWAAPAPPTAPTPAPRSVPLPDLPLGEPWTWLE